MKKTSWQRRWMSLALCLCLLASVFPFSGMAYAADSGAALEVTFSGNGDGGASLKSNQMKEAVEAALGSGDKTKVTAIRLTGSASEITGWNWRYLLELYRSNSGWTNLTELDLKGMSGLAKVENDKSGYNGIPNLTAVHFPESLQTIGDTAFYKCTGLTTLTFQGDAPPRGDWQQSL